jgi:hypothetical protein
MRLHAVWKKFTEVSKVHAASVFKVEEKAKQ